MNINRRKTFMCGRYYIMKQIYQVLKDMGVDVQWNQILLGDCFPKQKIPVIVENHGKLEIKKMQWGYRIPYTSQLIINARCETLLEKKLFQKDVKERRCLIFAKGFYEWDGHKHQVSFESVHDPILLMAGIYNDKEEVVIITKNANDVMKPVHSRMPLIIDQHDIMQWFDTTISPYQFYDNDYPIQIVSGAYQPSLF